MKKLYKLSLISVEHINKVNWENQIGTWYFSFVVHSSCIHFWVIYNLANTTINKLWVLRGPWTFPFSTIETLLAWSPHIPEMPFILLLTDYQWWCHRTSFGCDLYELLSSCTWMLCSGNGAEDGQSYPVSLPWSRLDWNS